MPLLGAHMSIAGGLSKAIERGEELKCEAIQIFTQSSRTWKIPALLKSEVTAFREARQKAKSVKSVFAHNSYLINLSTSTPGVREKSTKYFVEVMERCEALGVDALVTHPGSHLGAGIDEGIRLTAMSLDEVMESCPGFRTRILLENTAGQGACIGHEFSQLRRIVESTKDPDRVGFCFDTQHAFAAGYDLRTAESYSKTMEEFEKFLGTEKIVAFHLNDALKEFNCRVDRHEGIGRGFLGKTAFELLLNDSRFKDRPMCLETDPGDEMKNYKRELKLLKNLIKIS
jgi:deoxyribonuclease IV